MNKSSNRIVANAVQVSTNGKFGFDPATAVARRELLEARVRVQNARLRIGSAEDNDEAPGQAREMEKILKAIDSLIGWLNGYA